MGNLYNNVGATGLVARSNHYCPVIMGDQTGRPYIRVVDVY